MKKKLLFVWIGFICFSLYIVSDYLLESNRSSTMYDELRDQVNIIAANDSDVLTEFSHEPSHNKSEKVITEKFQFLLEEVNQDIVGWITISGTSIDYPVVKGEDNDFYLDHNVNKRKVRSGSIFMDFRNSRTEIDSHTVLYGHHMRDRSMFSNLSYYKNEDFFNEFQFIEYHTLYEQIEWEIFSVYVTDTDFNYIETDFSTNQEFRQFIDRIVERSLFNRKIEITESDQIITLSTCDYDFKDARLVVHAKKVK